MTDERVLEEVDNLMEASMIDHMASRNEDAFTLEGMLKDEDCKPVSKEEYRDHLTECAENSDYLSHIYDSENDIDYIGMNQTGMEQFGHLIKFNVREEQKKVSL